MTIKEFVCKHIKYENKELFVHFILNNVRYKLCYNCFEEALTQKNKND